VQNDFFGLVSVSGMHAQWASHAVGGYGIEDQTPVAFGIGLGDCTSIAELNLYAGAGRRAAPDGHGLVTLQYHVIAEHGWQLERGFAADLIC
jgi:hypothetical protein